MYIRHHSRLRPLEPSRISPEEILPSFSVFSLLFLVKFDKILVGPILGVEKKGRQQEKERGTLVVSTEQ